MRHKVEVQDYETENLHLGLVIGVLAAIAVVTALIFPYSTHLAQIFLFVSLAALTVITAIKG